MNQEAIVNQKTTIKEALQVIDKLGGQTLFIVNDDGAMVGTLSDGDIRRALIKDFDILTVVKDIMLTEFRALQKEEFSLDKLKEYKKLNIQYIPLLNLKSQIEDIINLKNLKSFIPLEAIIMAGGKGSRLRPHTLTTPKPLLKINDKPIIEYNIDRLIQYGINKIYISVNYLKDQIKEYFGDGSSRGIQILYIEETEITGTLGSATYIDKICTNEVLVMNSDLLTNINFEELYRTYLLNKSEMTVATVPYEVNIPYGVVETHASKVTSLKEKPTYTYYSNAGIYIIRSQCLREIPQKSFYNATDLINKLLTEQRVVSNYPIMGYWLDIGKPKDFEKAQDDVKHIEF